MDTSYEINPSGGAGENGLCILLPIVNRPITCELVKQSASFGQIRASDLVEPQGMQRVALHALCGCLIYSICVSLFAHNFMNL